MTDRALNFSAGPAVLPESVIRQAQQDLWNFDGSGMGVCELSHRGKHFDRILAGAEAACREIGRVPDDFRILFLQGGATTQTDMIPMSFLRDGATADYLDTGKWAYDAIKEAKRYGKVHVVASTRDVDYSRLPTDDECSFTPDAAYCLFVSNNTIFGTQFDRVPPSPAPIICDMSSDFFSRPIDYAKYDMLYGGAQKNLGPSGQALVIISDAQLARAPQDTVGVMFDYNVQATKGSRHNTPNTFAIYLMGLVFKWLLKEFGTLEEVDRYNREKAKIIYDAIDGSDFYAGHAAVDDRSLMNITFRSPTPELDAEFVKQAEAAGLTTLKGHRSIGGMRASVYNAFPVDGCRRLVEFMQQFEAQHKGSTTVATA